MCAPGPTTHVPFMFMSAEVRPYSAVVLTSVFARYFAQTALYIAGCIPSHLPLRKMASRACYPKSAQLETMTTVDAVLAWSGVPKDAWIGVMKKLGAEDIDMPVMIASLPSHTVVSAVKTWMDEVSPFTLTASRVAMTYNCMRVMYDMEIIDCIPPPAPAHPPPSSQAVLPLATEVSVLTVKVKLSQVIDQASDQEISLQPSAKLDIMRKRYIDLFGAPPRQSFEVSDSQLTALQWKMDAGLAPYADFGVWGPHGARMERRLRFTSRHVLPDGTWRTVELPGADCMQTWLECWSIYRTAAIMCRLALSSSLDRYSQMFEERCARYPTAWHICAQADIRCRQEYMIECKREQERFKTANPSLSSYDPAFPWNSVLIEAADNRDFWDNELDKPALMWTVGAGKNRPNHVDRQPPDQGAPGAAKKRPRGGRRGNRDAKSPEPPWKAPKKEPKGQPKGKGKGDKNGHPRINPKTGNYATTGKGKQVCFTWTQEANGCTDGHCPNNRAHMCDICLQPHRAVRHDECTGGSSGSNK